MQKKKKILNKENIKNKKVPLALATIQSFNYTEEIRLPTYSSNQLKNMIRSIDLRKSSIQHPYKKPVSRKSANKSIRQNTIANRPPEFKNMMKTFKQLKRLHQNQRSKSKSPASCKSKSSKKFFPKKKSFQTLRTNPNSQINLSLKLDKTIKQLNEVGFFKDQESLLPMKSSSDIINITSSPETIILQNEQDINLTQLRQFCSTKVFIERSSIGLSLRTYHTFKQNMAALKIQRAWKQYQTKRLIQRYVYLSNQQFQEQNQPNQFNAGSQGLSQIENNQKEYQAIENGSQKPMQNIVLPSSEQFYEQNQDEQSRVRHISNLQEQGNSINEDYEQMIKKMKMQQLQKWNEIIKLISLNKSDNPQQLQVLLKKLTQKSETNKKQLQQKSSYLIALSSKKKHSEHTFKSSEDNIQNNYINLFKNQNSHSSSQQSHPLQEYDSKKYIEYLDGDIFPIQDDQSAKIHHSATISKRKQEILLQQLKLINLPIKLGQNELYRSQSMRVLQKNGHKRQVSKNSSRNEMRKSTSQKILRRIIQELNDNSVDEYQEQMNFDLLTREFLEGTDPSSQNLDMLYSEQKLRSKLAELNNLKNEDSFSENELNQYEINEEHFFDNNRHQPLNMNNNDDSSELKRSDHVPKLHDKSMKQTIKIEDQSPQGNKIKMHVYEMEIEENESDEGNSQQNQKNQNIATLLLNQIIIEVLKDISRSDKLANSFKDYSLSLKTRIKKAQPNKKKKGFPTTKTEIQLFLDGLIKYLNKQETKVFKNLQISTGPSALQMLRYMHQSGDEQLEEQSDEDQSNVMVIPNRVFDAFWQLKEKSIIIEVPESFDKANSAIFKHQFELLKSFNKIFYRSLFDTFNECLDCQRNFGQYGKPFPWKRAASFHHVKDQQTLQVQVANARKKMMQISTTYCGLIVQKQQMATINEDYIKQVHQDRLSRMLASDLMQSEPRWMFYDDQETQILVQISNGIYTEILIQIIEEIYEYF